MTNRKMKQLALAVGVALGGMGIMPSAQAVNVAADNMGQALIFPYYTVRDGWSTLFGVTNTSDSVVAVKVRFHEAYNSRDVFDFNIILSPHDVWTGWVADGANGPVMFSEDKSCTVGLIPSTGQPFPAPVSYVGAAADGGPTTADRMREGYVEMIVMGMVRPPATDTTGLPSFALSRGAIHASTGTPPGCAALVTAFQTASGLAALQAQFGYDSAAGTGTLSAVPAAPATPVGTSSGNSATALNPLTGTFSLVNGVTGLNTSGRPVALANFWVPFTAGSTGRDTATTNLNNLITAQLPPASIAPVLPNTAFTASWHEPSLNSANTNGIVFTPLALSGIATPTIASSADLTGYTANGTVAANAVSFVLQARNVVNEWTRRTNPSAGWVTETDWVVTFPTKTFYVDADSTSEYAGRASGRATSLPTLNDTSTAGLAAPFANFFTSFNSSTNVVTRNGKACDSTGNTIYNREESSITGQGFSPGGSTSMCYETNVLTFAGSNILGSGSPISQSLDSLPGEFGWLNLGLVATNSSGGSTVTNWTGLPAVGFEITTRTNSITGNTSLNSAGLVNHAYLP